MSSPTVTGTPADPDLPRPWAARVAGALAHRNFRILWFAALGSTIGTWMQKYAQGLLVYDLTQSKFYLGIDDFLAQLPILLFMLIGGVIADRHDRRRLLAGSQIIQAFSAFALAILVWTGHITVWHVFALSFVSGLGQSFGGPAYQSLIPSLVPKKDVLNAIALNSSQFNLSRVLGPGAGAAVLALIGTAWCFAVNGLSFFLVIIALAALRVPRHEPTVGRQSIGTELKAGVAYVWQSGALRTITWLVAVSMFLSMPLLTMLPAFAKEVLQSDLSHETQLFLLMAAQGLGAIAGALFIDTVRNTRNKGRLLLSVQLGLGLLMAAFASARSLPISLVLLFVVGMFYMGLFSISFSMVQLTVPEHLRGRVVSIYMVALRGGGPLGGLLAGALMDQFSTAGVMAANGLILAALAGLILLFRRDRQLDAQIATL